MCLFLKIFYVLMSITFAILYFHKFCNVLAYLTVNVFNEVRQSNFNEIIKYCDKKFYAKITLYFSLFFFFAVGTIVSIAGCFFIDETKIPNLSDFEMIYRSICIYLGSTFALIGALSIGIPVTPTYEKGDGEERRLQYEAYLERKANGNLGFFEENGLSIFSIILYFRYWFIGYVGFLAVKNRKKYGGEYEY